MCFTAGSLQWRSVNNLNQETVSLNFGMATHLDFFTTSQPASACRVPLATSILVLSSVQPKSTLTPFSAADSGIKVESAENPELSKALSAELSLIHI